MDIEWLIFFVFWNMFASSLLAPGWKTVFEGECLRGLAKIGVMCLVPHVAVGLWFPAIWYGFPSALLFYVPHAILAYRVRGQVLEDLEEREARGATTELGRGVPQFEQENAPTAPPPRPSFFGEVMGDITQGTGNPMGAFVQGFGLQGPRFPERYRLARARLAEDNQECAICCEALCTDQLGILMKSERALAPRALGRERVCQHYFHLKCADDLKDARINTCPLCRERFSHTRRFPQCSVGEQNEEWFYLASLGTITINQGELSSALTSILPFAAEAVDEKVEEWFTGRDGLTLAEFNTRVPPLVESAFQPEPQAATSAPPMPSLPGASAPPLFGASPAPDAPSAPMMFGGGGGFGLPMRQQSDTIISPNDVSELFTYMDRNRSGTVDTAQVLRGLLRLEPLRGRRFEVEQIVFNVFARPRPQLEISRADFCAPRGAFDRICNELGIQADDLFLGAWLRGLG